MQQEPVVSAAAAQNAPVLMPGCENAADQENCENPKGYEDNKQTATPAAEAAMEQPKRSSKTPTQ